MPAPNWQVSTLPVLGDWRGVEFGGGRFIAYQIVSTAGAYSDDRGATWHALRLPLSVITSMAYIGGVWFCSRTSLDKLEAFKSTDGGITWTTWQTPSTGTGGGIWRNLIVCNDRLYLFADGGTTAYYTTDGNTWTQFTIPVAGNFESMAYGNGRYILIQKESRRQLTSTDGITWETLTLPSAPYNGWTSVAYGNGCFVVANQSDGYFARSTDGITWETVDVDHYVWAKVVFGAGVFVAISTGSSAYWSDDGKTWAASSSSYCEAICSADNTFIVMLFSGSSGTQSAQRAVYNRAPNTPETISHGQPNAGENLTVSTTGSTDPDGDVVTYVWERRIDSGAWTQITGTGTTITDAVPSTATNIQYRVKAVDNSGAASAYRTGTQTAIYYNQAPGVPASISFGLPRAGKQLAITCAAVTDPEGDSFSYVWERSVSGGTFSQIGITTVNAFNDTVPMTGTTYNVRVKTVDSRGNESAYRTGTAQAIDHNVAPTISGSDANRGTVTAPFSFAYTLTDADAGDTLTVVEAVDGREIRRFTTTSGTSHTANISGVWLTMTNGTHRLTITVSDQDGASATRTITFARQTTRIATCRKIALNVRPKKVFLSLFPIPPAGTSVTVQVCNNPFDPSPTWENISGKQNALVHTFTNTTVTNGNGLGYRFAIDPADGQTASFFEAVVRYA